MGCLGCEFIAHSVVTLRDCRQVCSSCEDWRHECEARHVANMKSNRERVAYVEGVEEKRGKAAAEALKTEAKEIMACSQSQLSLLR
jgi:hypothetical protein